MAESKYTIFRRFDFTEKNYNSLLDFRGLQLDIHINSVRKGFYARPFNASEKLMLIVSEISEALEALRAEKLSDPVKFGTYNEWFYKQDNYTIEAIEAFESNFKNTFEDELADAVIRILDLAEHCNIDLQRHIIMKHYYNRTRPYKHNKDF